MSGFENGGDREYQAGETQFQDRKKISDSRNCEVREPIGNTEVVVQRATSRIRQHFIELDYSTPDKMFGACGLASAAARFMVLREGSEEINKGIDAKVITTRSLFSQFDISGDRFTHGVCFVKDNEGKVYLIDEAFLQYLDDKTGEFKSGSKGTSIYKDGSDSAARMANNLIESGYVELDEHKLQDMMRLLSPQHMHKKISEKVKNVDMADLFDKMNDDYNPKDWTKEKLEEKFPV